MFMLHEKIVQLHKKTFQNSQSHIQKQELSCQMLKWLN